MAGMPAAGDMDIGRWCGDGVGMGDPVSEKSPASERVERLAADCLEARAAAVASA
ncbi:MAG: hypothetical protein INR71_12105, partial [Terriglobus roseus]|nr:hypothetical protein [Terriglobus roseus]